MPLEKIQFEKWYEEMVVVVVHGTMLETEEEKVDSRDDVVVVRLV